MQPKFIKISIWIFIAIILSSTTMHAMHKKYSRTKKKRLFHQANMGGIPTKPPLTKIKKKILCNPKALTILLHLRAKNNIHIDQKDSRGCALLHYAAAYGHADAVQILLQAGANPHLEFNILDEAPLIFAIINGNKKTVELLLHYWPQPTRPGFGWRANPDHKTKGLIAVRGLVFSSLHWAIKFGRESIVQTLLDYGASCTVRTNTYKRSGLNALGLAEYYYNSHFNPQHKEVMSRIIYILKNHINKEQYAFYYQ
jgi:hypothetical protein